MKVLNLIIALVLLSTLYSCGPSCGGDTTPPAQVCDNGFDFTFDTDSQTGFMQSELDTLIYVRIDKSDSSKIDTFHLERTNFGYELIPSHSSLFYDFSCFEFNTIALGVDFDIDETLAYNYDIIVPGIKTFSFRNLVAEGEMFGKRCPRFRITKQSVELNGILIDLLRDTSNERLLSKR